MSTTSDDHIPMKSKPLLQVALDSINLDEVFQTAELIQDYVDILEIGTILLKKEGIHIIEKMKEIFPQKLIFVDTKTVDLGRIEAQVMFEAGADMMSVCSLASDATISLVIHEAPNSSEKSPDRSHWFRRFVPSGQTFDLPSTGLSDRAYRH